MKPARIRWTSCRASLPTVRRLTLTVFLALCSCTCAQRPGFSVPEYARNRTFWIASDAPVTRFFNEHSVAISSTKILLDHVKRVERATLQTMANRTLPHPDDPLRVCNSNSPVWKKVVKIHFGRRGFADPNTECITDFYGTKLDRDDEPPSSASEMFDVIMDRANSINLFVKNITDAILGNWTNPELAYRAEHRRLSQQCVVLAVGVAREQGNWHLFTSITNAPQYQQLPDFERQFLVEYLRIGPDGRYAEPPVMRIPRRAEDGRDQVMFSNVTTSLESWSRTAGGTVYGATYPEDNPAVIAALDGTDLYVQQAEDAMTVSGIAILVLPLFFNIVPIALLADVSALTMLAYIVMSDILTAIPLCIKGAELIFIGKKRERTLVLRLTSAIGGSVSESAAGELWAAECRANDSVLKTGIVFVVVSVVSMIFGVVAEFVARDLVRKRIIVRKRRLMAVRSTRSDGSSINSDKIGVPIEVLSMDLELNAGKERRE